MKALCLDFRHGFEVSLSGCALILGAWLDVWRQFLQREVGAAASGMWLGNDDTRRDPSIEGLGSAGGCNSWG